jgi:hypothetical protein
MSNLILNDNIIGGSSNDSSDILYTPNDNRVETNVQDELDRINTNLSGLLALSGKILDVRYGGISQTSTSTTVTFDEPFEDSNYIVLLTAINSNASLAFTSYVTSKTATGFSYKQRYQGTSGGAWTDYQGGVSYVAIHL